MKKEPVYIDIKEYNFCIRPFNAFDGGYAMLFITKKLLPMLKAMAGGNETAEVKALLDTEVGEGEALEWDRVFEVIEPILGSIDRKELNEFMELCLAQIDIRMKAGYMPLYKHGVFADDDIGCSTTVCLRLCFEVIKPLVIDFFEENGLNLSQLFKKTTNLSAQ